MKIEKKNKDNYVDADVTQLEHSNNKYYVSTFIYIYIYIWQSRYFLDSSMYMTMFAFVSMN